MYPMKYFLASAIICAFAGSLCSCHRQPDLVPRLILEGEPVGREFYLSAPYIAVVKITNQAAAGPRKAIVEGEPKDLVLVKYDAIVENTIRGKFPTPNISFYFFMYFGQKHFYNLNPGERYIVSLRTEGGVFRSWSDATQLKIEVSSGSHNQQDLPLRLGPEATIAYILLTPGDDLPMDKYHLDGYQIGMMRDGGDILVVPKYAYELLTNVQKHGDPRVRGAACRAGALIFPNLPKCVTADNPDPVARERLRDTLDMLQKTPSALLPERWNKYLLEMLEIYTDDARPAVRAAACADLRNIAPERKVANCP
jgi:hypothetical protein